MQRHVGQTRKRRSENKSIDNIYTTPDRRKKKGKRKSSKGNPENILPRVESKTHNKKTGQDTAPLEKHETFSQASAEECVPSELRSRFRWISNMAPDLRPKNKKVIRDFFSKCQLCVPRNQDKTSPTKTNPFEAFLFFEWNSDTVDDPRQDTQSWSGDDAEERGDDSSEFQDTCRCIAWIKKDVTLNNNMYFCFHGKNISVRRIIFEWFVGPTELTQEEKRAFEKKRSRLRKKPRRIHSSCNFKHCMHPEHLVATPKLPAYARTEENKEYSCDAELGPQHERRRGGPGGERTWERMQKAFAEPLDTVHSFEDSVETKKSTQPCLQNGLEPQQERGMDMQQRAQNNLLVSNLASISILSNAKKAFGTLFFKDSHTAFVLCKKRKSVYSVRRRKRSRGREGSIARVYRNV